MKDVEAQDSQTGIQQTLRDLTSLFKSEIRPQAIVEVCRKVVQATVCCLYSWDVLDYQLLDYASSSSSSSENEEIVPFSPQLILPLVRRSRAQNMPVLDDIDGKAIAVSSLSNGTGCIICWYSDLACITQENLLWLQLITNYVSIVSKQRIPPEMDDLKHEFLLALKRGTFPTTVRLQASAFSEFSIQLPHIAFLIEAQDEFSKPLARRELLLPAEKSLQTCESKLIIPMDEGLTCFISIPNLTDEAHQLREVLRERFLVLQSALPSVQLFAGVSNLHHISEFSRAITEGEKALQISKKKPGGLVLYREWSLYDEDEEDPRSIQTRLKKLNPKTASAVYWFLLTRNNSTVASQLHVAEGTIRNWLDKARQLVPEIDDYTQAESLLAAFHQIPH